MTRRTRVFVLSAALFAVLFLFFVLLMAKS
jgi:hypothetical protein